jgi:tetratricopeptide (TPR) repeat protein
MVFKYQLNFMLKRNIAMQFYKLVIFVFLILSITQSYSQTERKTYDKGYLEYHEGIPFVWLNGTEYEVGVQYGKLLKNEIEKMIVDYSKFREQEIGLDKMPFFKRIFYSVFGEHIIRKKIRETIVKLPEDIHQMIRGVAAGASVPIQTIYEINLFHELTQCSSFLIKRDGRIILARNLDDPTTLLGKHPVIVNCSIDGKNSYVQVGTIALMFTVTGINEAGISISTNTIHLKNNKMGNCKGHAYLNKIMTDCSNLAEVESLLDTINLNIGYILPIASQQENKAAMFEVSGNINVRTDVVDVAYASNHTISSKLREFEDKNSQEFNNTARDDKFNELYNPKDNADLINEAVNILACTDFYHYTSMLHERTTINNNLTGLSAIFDPANHSIYFASNAYYAAWSKWIKYNTQTGKISVFRDEDDRLRDKTTTDFVKYLTETKKLESAIEVKAYFKELTSQGLDNFHTLTNAYNKYFFLKEYAMAKQEALKLVDRYPDIVTGYYYVGLIYEKEGAYKDAISWYFKSQSATITNEYRKLITIIHLAYAYHGLGDIAQAKIYANQALQIYKQYYIPVNDKDFIRLEEIRNQLQEQV